MIITTRQSLRRFQKIAINAKDTEEKCVLEVEEEVHDCLENTNFNNIEYKIISVDLNRKVSKRVVQYVKSCHNCTNDASIEVRKIRFEPTRARAQMPQIFKKIHSHDVK